MDQSFLLAPLMGAALGFFLNKVRGGTWAFSRGIKGAGAWIAAAGLAAPLAFLSQDLVLAAAFAIAYIAGESIGWTKWIWCIPGKMTQEYYNQNWAVDAPVKHDKEWGESFLKGLVDEHKNYWIYCFLGMTFRGILWWAPVFAVFAWWFSTLGGRAFSPEVLSTMAPLAVLVTIGLGVLFPLSYWLASRLSPNDSDYIGWAEGLYGAIYGAVLGLVVFMVAIVVALSHFT